MTDPPTATLPALAFTGWLRQRGRRWEPVIRATSEAACWDGLLGTPRSGSCDLVVLRHGEHPVRAAAAKGGGGSGR